ncbi:GNAT family N-acetyltransferase [Candidatus Bipolaricaulota bacterium]
MNRHTLNLRPANPTIDEGLVCARHLDETAEGFFGVMLGRRVAEILAQAYIEPSHSYSYENVLFAEQNGHIIGMALSFTAAQYRAFTDRPLKRAAGFPALRMRTVQLLTRPMLQVLKTIADGDFYLLSIGIDEDQRGKGVGSALMDAVEERARAAGSKRLSLDVAAKNEGARRLYERRGMTVASQWPKRLPLAGIRLYRMTKTLTPRQAEPSASSTIF